MKNILERKFIESLVKSENQDFAGAIQEKVINLVALSIENLATRVPFISIDNVILQPVNETFNGAITSMSKYVYFLGIDSPQMELNSLSYNPNFKKYKDRFIQAWHDTKRKKSRRRRQKEEEKSHQYVEFEPEKYNLEAFRRDLQLSLVENLSITSIVFNTTDRLIIQGKDDFGSTSQIEIIPTIYDGEYFKYFLGRRKGFVKINMDERLINFNIKYETAGKNFFLMIKLFNNLFKNLTKENVNQIFVESLLYNIPDEFYHEDDIYSIFIKIINYLNMTDVSEFVLIEDKSKKIFKSNITKGSAGLYNKFMKHI